MTRRTTIALGLALLLPTAGELLPAGEDGEGAAITVDLFVAVDCPIANAYAPTINRLHEAFAPKGVRIRLIYPESSLTGKEIASHREEYGLLPEGFPDPEHELVKRAGARYTPEAAVFDAGGTLRYRGRIDNLFSDYGDRRRTVTEKYLEDAIRRLVAGETVEFHETEAIGCLIEDVPARAP